MRGVILAGGTGSRLAPFTKTTNKHLAPVYAPTGAIPMIYYPIQTLIGSGVKEILIVSSQEHSGSIIEVLGDGDQFGCEFTYKIQDMNNPKKPVGIASALKLAQGFVGEQNFAVILGDNYYEETFGAEFTYFDLINTRDVVRETPNAKIFLKRVQDPERFGVATLNYEEINGKLNNIVTKIVEKPKVPETDYAVTGLYLFSNHVFKLVPKLQVSDRGELEITDINNWYVNNRTMDAHELKGYWHDMGVVSGIKKVQNHLEELHSK